MEEVRGQVQQNTLMLQNQCVLLQEITRQVAGDITPVNMDNLGLPIHTTADMTKLEAALQEKERKKAVVC